MKDNSKHTLNSFGMLIVMC